MTYLLNGLGINYGECDIEPGTYAIVECANFVQDPKKNIHHLLKKYDDGRGINIALYLLREHYDDDDDAPKFLMPTGVHWIRRERML